MDSNKEFKKQVLKVESTWETFKPYKGFQKLYIKFMYRTRLICRVLKRLRAYKIEPIPTMETVETIIELDEEVEVINTIRKTPKLLYSLKILLKGISRLQAYVYSLSFLYFFPNPQ